MIIKGNQIYPAKIINQHLGLNDERISYNIEYTKSNNALEKIEVVQITSILPWIYETNELYQKHREQ